MEVNGGLCRTFCKTVTVEAVGVEKRESLGERVFNGRVRCDFLVHAHRGKYELEADPTLSGREERNFVVLGLPFFQNYFTLFNYTSLTLYIDLYQDLYDRRGMMIPTVSKTVLYF